MDMIRPDSYTRGGIVIDDGPHRLGPSGDSVGGDLDLSDAVELVDSVEVVPAFAWAKITIGKLIIEEATGDE